MAGFRCFSSSRHAHRMLSGIEKKLGFQESDAVDRRAEMKKEARRVELRLEGDESREILDIFIYIPVKSSKIIISLS